jgi:hypothetical protein
MKPPPRWFPPKPGREKPVLLAASAVKIRDPAFNLVKLPSNSRPFFYGLKIFRCKTAQFRVTRRECLMTETPSISDAVQLSENARKNSFSNYKSAALPAEPALTDSQLADARQVEVAERKPVLHQITASLAPVYC